MRQLAVIIAYVVVLEAAKSAHVSGGLENGRQRKPGSRGLERIERKLATSSSGLSLGMQDVLSVLREMAASLSAEAATEAEKSLRRTLIEWTAVVATSVESGEVQNRPEANLNT